MESRKNNALSHREARPGDAQAVMDLQRWLRLLSAVNGGSAASLPVDGICGPATHDAIAAFQKENGLPVTGTADRATWEAIRAAYAEAAARARRPEPVFFFPTHPVGYTLEPGSDGILVYVVQLLLRELLLRDGLPEASLTPDGRYGPRTAEAVRAFQRTRGLPVTGSVDLATWNRLAYEQSVRTVGNARE